MAKPFKVEGLTVKQILELQPDELSSFDEREMSRALRTVSLAANKRVRRLKENAKYSRSEGKYVTKKSAKQNIALDALNAVTKDGTIKGDPFGVSKAKGRNDMYHQLSQIRQFMNAKTSTVKGAKAVRQAREKRLLGKTTEQLTRGMTKAQQAQKKAEINNIMSETYRGFRKYLEANGIPNNPYENFEGSDTILTIIKTKVIETGDHEAGLQEALDRDTVVYEAEKEEEKPLDPFDLLGEE